MNRIKLLTIAAIVLLTSCNTRKDYKCICAGGWGGGEYREFIVKSVSERRASAKCQESGAPRSTDDGIYCDLEQ